MHRHPSDRPHQRALRTRALVLGAVVTLSPGLAVSGAAAAVVDSAVPARVPARVAAGAAPRAVGPTGDADAAQAAQAAQAALGAVEAIFADGSGAGDRGTTEWRGSGPSGTPASGADVTMALRDLANTRVHLDAADRARAEALLRRPTSGGGDGTLSYSVREARPSCTRDLCVHYVRSTQDAPRLADRSGNGVPDYVDTVRSTMQAVHDRYRSARYREPLPDRGRGGDNRIDIYLGDLGNRGIYGYCTSDQPEPDPTPATFDRWAYCALDDDYTEFRTPPLASLRVTAAHEYFHAVQYAYDRYEDSWLLEATAAWAEDELYDKVNDNRQYFAASQLRSPGRPVDTFSRNGFHYGTWTFIRFLTEKYRAKQGGLAKIVHDLFGRLDGSRGAPDLYSWQGIQRVLRARGSSAAAALGQYAVANRTPAASYSEGRFWPTAPLARRPVRLSTDRRGFSSTTRLRHLTTSTTRFVPRGLRGAGWRIRVDVDLGVLSHSPVALVTRYGPRGKKVDRVRLGPRGQGALSVAFGSAETRAVEVTLVNGSGRFRCFSGGAFSCQGTSLDDGEPAALAVRVSRG